MGFYREEKMDLFYGAYISLAYQTIIGWISDDVVFFSRKFYLQIFLFIYNCNYDMIAKIFSELNFTDELHNTVDDFTCYCLLFH